LSPSTLCVDKQQQAADPRDWHATDHRTPDTAPGRLLDGPDPQLNGAARDPLDRQLSQLRQQHLTAMIITPAAVRSGQR
jgi:hypothetical protein